MNDMFKSIKEAAGPSIFTKGLLKYKQGKYEEAKRLALKAGQWMPELKNDDLYKATLLLVDSQLGAKINNSEFKIALEALANSPYRINSDYSVIVADLQIRIKGYT